MTTPGPAVDAFSRPVMAFLADALAPSPARWRNTLRLTLLCCLGTILVMALHVPNGEFLIIFFFAVSLPDAWASLRKARLRGIGSLIGGALAVLCILALGDKPWLWFVVQGGLLAAGLFLARTTTAPYAAILALLTFVLATPEATTNPNLSLERVLWRVLLTLVGAVIGTLAQLCLWPERPRDVLLRGLGSRLRKAEEIIADVSAGRAGMHDALYGSDLSTGTVNELDLLASAEAGSPWVRERHAEHLKLIRDVEAILVAASRLEQRAGLLPAPAKWSKSARLAQVRERVARLRAAIQGQASRPSSIGLQNNEGLKPKAETGEITSLVLFELECTLREAESSVPFLMMAEGKSATDDPSGKPMAGAARKSAILTPACTLSNVDAVQFGLKGALAASICYVIYQALNWPGISTCVVTTLLVAQSSFGAGLQRSVLRLVGATLGGVTAALVIAGLVPNMVSLASFVVAVGALYFIAAWITTGNARVSYVGLQMGLALSLVLVNEPRPTIDLTPAFDRVIGVLIGITVMGFIDLALWPSFAGTALIRKLAYTQRALADLARWTQRRDWEKADAAALEVRRRLATALSLYDEAGLEFGASHGRYAERRHFLAITHRLEEAFFAVLMRLRFRRNLDESSFPETWRRQVEAFDDAVVRRFESLANAPAKTEPGTLMPAEWNPGNLAEPSEVQERSAKPSGTDSLEGEEGLLRQDVAASLDRLEREVRQSVAEAPKVARQLADGFSS